MDIEWDFNQDVIDEGNFKKGTKSFSSKIWLRKNSYL